MPRILAVAVLAVGCSHAAQSPKLGRLDILSSNASDGTQPRFVEVSADGFDLTWVGGYAHFEAARAGSPCATGIVGGLNEKRLEICPLGEGNWHTRVEIRSAESPMPGDGFEFSATKLPDGCISVGRLGAQWSVEIADQGAAPEVLRTHPELLGAAVTLGLLPLHHEHYFMLVAAK